MSTLTTLLAGLVALTGDGNRLAVAPSYPAFDYSQAPAYTLPNPLLPAAPAITASVPGMGTAEVVTVVLKASKPAAAEGLYMLFGIKDTDSGNANYTDLCYAGRQYNTPAGLATNTYTSGFTGSTDLTVLDNGATVIITAKLYQRSQSTQFELYVNGVQQTLGSFSGQLNRSFSNTLTVGDTMNLRWPGTIYALKLYLTDLTTSQRLQVEASL